MSFTVGLSVNYVLAYRFGRPFVMKRMDGEHLEQVTRLWDRWGLFVYVVFGLTPVLPVELLSFVCGFLKTPVATFLVLSFVPRLIVFAVIVFFGRYIGVWIGV